MIVTSRTRTRPPAGALRVNRGNPIGARVRWISAPGIDGGRFDGRETIDAGAVRSRVRDWPAATFTSGAVVIAPGTFPHAPGTIVAACLLDKDTDAGFGYVMGCDYNGTDEPLALRMYSQQVQLSAYHSSGGGGTFSHSVSALSDGEYVLLFGRVNGASSSVGVVSLDAATKRPVVSSTSGSIGTSPAWASRNFFIGTGLQSGVGYWRRYAQPIALVGWADGLLSDADLISLWANPAQVFATPPRIVHFAAAGGAAELVGAGTAGATGTGALTTAIPIVGAAVVSAAGVGALSTAISLVGASATVSASGSGNLTTTIRLDGAALASVAGAGALTAQITLSGAALASVVGTGALTTAPAGLAGDATGGATGTGTLTTGIALAGSASVSAIGAGGLVTGIPLSGGATAAVTGSGDLAITLSGLSGAALASVVGGGALLTSITLSGAALASALGSGVLTTIGVETYGIRGVRGAQVQGRKRPAQITRAKRRN